MELRQLEHFVAVAERGHFGRASVHCHISQSALSASIRSLERELGTALFFRTTRKVEMTEAGRALLDEARGVLAAAASARESVAAVLGLLRGSLRVGGVPTPGLFDQALMLAKFGDRHPSVDVYYVRDTSTALVLEVENSRLDVALVGLPLQLPKGVRAVPLVTEPLMFVCRPDHPLADRKRIASKTLVGEVFIDPPKGSTTRQLLERIFTSAGAERQVSFDLNDPVAALDFVAAGLGVTVLRRALAKSRSDLRAIPLSDKTLTWTLAAVVSRDHPTLVARAFLDLLLEQSLAPVQHELWRNTAPGELHL
jgi:DNA-binding transcriptional LysR family regulator